MTSSATLASSVSSERNSAPASSSLMRSLSGQVARVRRGCPFLVFGDGHLTATEPISDDALGDFLAARLSDPSWRGRLPPIGGPGPTLTPIDQADILGRPARLRRVPPVLPTGAARAPALATSLPSAVAGKAAPARVGHRCATRSMLVLNPATGRCHPRDRTHHAA